jgi:hypothetical protein
VAADAFTVLTHPAALLSVMSSRALKIRPEFLERFSRNKQWELRKSNVKTTQPFTVYLGSSGCGASVLLKYRVTLYESMRIPANEISRYLAEFDITEEEANEYIGDATYVFAWKFRDIRALSPPRVVENTAGWQQWKWFNMSDTWASLIPAAAPPPDRGPHAADVAAEAERADEPESSASQSAQAVGGTPDAQPAAPAASDPDPAGRLGANMPIAAVTSATLGSGAAVRDAAEPMAPAPPSLPSARRPSRPSPTASRPASPAAKRPRVSAATPGSSPTPAAADAAPAGKQVPIVQTWVSKSSKHIIIILFRFMSVA